MAGTDESRPTKAGSGSAPDVVPSDGAVAGMPDLERQGEIGILNLRLDALRAASRPKEPLTEGGRPTAQGHIVSAITQLERRRELLYGNGR